MKKKRAAELYPDYTSPIASAVSQFPISRQWDITGNGAIRFYGHAIFRALGRDLLAAFRRAPPTAATHCIFTVNELIS